jgi:hypothetical protein
MAGVAHDPAFAQKVGIPQSVGKDFNKADTGTGILGEPKGKRPAHLQHMKAHGLK